MNEGVTPEQALRQTIIDILSELDGCTFSFDGRAKMEAIRERALVALSVPVPEGWYDVCRELVGKYLRHAGTPYEFVSFVTPDIDRSLHLLWRRLADILDALSVCGSPNDDE